MNRRSIFKAVAGVCAAVLFPWRKASGRGNDGTLTNGPTWRKAAAAETPLGQVDPFNDLLRVGRRQIRHVRQVGMEPVAMRLGRREREIICSGFQRLYPGVSDPTHFASLPIHWTDNECEIRVVTSYTIGGNINTLGGLSKT